MLNLLPTERWEYSLADAALGLSTSLLVRRPSRDIYLPGLGAALPIRSARAGIAVALKALGLRSGAIVGIPLYCCTVVFKAIRAAGYRACFLDVDPATYCISPRDLAAKSSRVDAVIAVHMFGNVCDMSKLREAAAGKPFVEDCAQALGSKLAGREAGSFGEIAVFSFRAGKYLSAGEGGAVYANDPALRARIANLIGALPAPRGVDEPVHVARTYVRSLLRRAPMWGLIGARLWEAYGERVSSDSQAPLVPAQIFETDCKTAGRRLPKLAAWIEKQRSNAGYYERNLTVEPGMLSREAPGGFYNRLQYPLLLPTSEQCAQMAAYLRENKISTARPYKDISAFAKDQYGYTGDCPEAESVARRVLVIPCNYGLKSADVERVAAGVNRAWLRVSSNSASERAATTMPAASGGQHEDVAQPRH